MAWPLAMLSFSSSSITLLPRLVLLLLTLPFLKPELVRDFGFSSKALSEYSGGGSLGVGVLVRSELGVSVGVMADASTSSASRYHFRRRV